MGLIPDEIPEKDQWIAQEAKKAFEQETDNAEDRQRHESVKMACKLLQKGFIPNISGELNPIQAVADWIDEAYNTNKQIKPSQQTNQDFEERLSKISGILVDVNRTANKAEKHIKDFQSTTTPLINRNTSLTNLLILNKLSVFEGTGLDDIGFILDIPRISPEIDRSYRERLKAKLK